MLLHREGRPYSSSFFEYGRAFLNLLFSKLQGSAFVSFPSVNVSRVDVNALFAPKSSCTCVLCGGLGGGGVNAGPRARGPVSLAGASWCGHLFVTLSRFLVHF